MAITLAFDIYGTLIDTQGIIPELTRLVGDKAGAVARTWREKQLEYSFRRGLMQNHKDFSVCTVHALKYACAYHEVSVSRGQTKSLLECYRVLPAFDDAKGSLQKLQAANFRLFAFSNGSAEAVDRLLQAAGLVDYFLGVVSADEIKSFKPNPGVYALFLRKAAATGSNAWLVSSNPFDVIGAVSAGMRAAWVKRSKQLIFDPWEIEPTLTVRTLDELEEKILMASK